MVISIVVMALCVCNIATIVYFTQVFHNLEDNFDAVSERFKEMDKELLRIRRSVNTHTEAFPTAFAEMGKLKHEYERLRCYVYNNVPQHTEEEEDTEDAV